MLYLLHSDKPLGGSGRASARHYLGWTTPETFHERVRRHRNGTGHVAMTNAFHRIGAHLSVVWVRWDGTRAQESYLKKQGQTKRFCPICNPGRRKHRFPNEWYSTGLSDDLPTPPGTRPKSRNGGVSSAGSTTAIAGTSPPARHRANTTRSSTGQTGPNATGGTVSTATVLPLPKEGTSHAGTRQP
jgi:hypothetical protein